MNWSAQQAGASALSLSISSLLGERLQHAFARLGLAAARPWKVGLYLLFGQLERQVRVILARRFAQWKPGPQRLLQATQTEGFSTPLPVGLFALLEQKASAALRRGMVRIKEYSNTYRQRKRQGQLLNKAKALGRRLRVSDFELQVTPDFRVSPTISVFGNSKSAHLLASTVRSPAKPRTRWIGAQRRPKARASGGQPPWKPTSIAANFDLAKTRVNSADRRFDYDYGLKRKAA